MRLMTFRWAELTLPLSLPVPHHGLSRVLPIFSSGRATEPLPPSARRCIALALVLSATTLASRFLNVLAGCPPLRRVLIAGHNVRSYLHESHSKPNLYSKQNYGPNGNRTRTLPVTGARRYQLTLGPRAPSRVRTDELSLEG